VLFWAVNGNQGNHQNFEKSLLLTDFNWDKAKKKKKIKMAYSKKLRFSTHNSQYFFEKI
jgi:hypothetical protein